jgi:hypothetical protein
VSKHAEPQPRRPRTSDLVHFTLPAFDFFLSMTPPHLREHKGTAESAPLTRPVTAPTDRTQARS